MEIETSISIFTVRWEQIEFEQHTIKAYPVTAHRSTGIGNRFCGAGFRREKQKGCARKLRSSGCRSGNAARLLYDQYNGIQKENLLYP